MKILFLSISLFFISEINSQSLNGKKLLEKAISYHDPYSKWNSFNSSFNITMESPKRPIRKSKIELNLPSSFFRLKVYQNENIIVSTLTKDKCILSFNGEENFTDEIKKLVPILVKAFAGVDSRKVIHIELKGKTGTTVGDAFSFKNYLSWRFESIHGETFFQKNNARGWSIFAWKLMPQKGQLYYKSSENKRIHKNWLVTKLNVIASKNSRNV